MVTEYVKETLIYMNENLRAEMVGVFVLAILVFFVVWSLLMLIFRRTRLWYWKVNQEVEALNRIEEKLTAQNSGAELDRTAAVGEEVTAAHASHLVEPCEGESLLKEAAVEDRQQEEKKLVFEKLDPTGAVIAQPAHPVEVMAEIQDKEAQEKKVQDGIMQQEAPAEPESSKEPVAVISEPMPQNCNCEEVEGKVLELEAANQSCEKDGFKTGKSGKVYSEHELRVLIRY